jgi:uncharacterized repeat protein (TIGR04138 family)
MSDFCRQVVEVARQHRRFSPEAYLFIFQALNYAQEEMGLRPSEPARPQAEGSTESVPQTEQTAAESEAGETPIERHITGQQLCEAIRQLALREFGYMAKAVFKSWGVTQTSDFGEMVYHLIDVELMKKTEKDRREHFDNVFDFETGLSQSFRIELSAAEEE